MVALSHATARELGYETDEDGGRPFVEVSGRKGLGVKADDLIDRLTAKASVGSRKAQSRPPAGGEPAGSPRRSPLPRVRYFMVKFSRGKVIVFDIDEALSFEGESGPYLQYAVVRANNIFNKLKERAGLDEAAVVAALASTPADSLIDRRREPTICGVWCSRRRGSTKSSTRRFGRWSCPCSPSTPSDLHRRSTASTTGIRSSTKSGRRADLAGGCRGLLSRAAHAGIGPDGLHRSRENVDDSDALRSLTSASPAAAGSTTTASVEQSGARPRVLEVSESPRRC